MALDGGKRSVDGDQNHSRSLNEDINVVKEIMKFSGNEVIEEIGSGGSRWRQKIRGWRPKTL